MKYIFDTHQDIAVSLFYLNNTEFYKKNSLHEGESAFDHLPVINQTDFFRLKKGGVKAVFGVCCALDIKEGKGLPSQDHLKETKKQLAFYHRLAEEGSQVKIIKNKEDLEKIKERELSFLLSLEGADSVTDEHILDELFAEGVRSIGLTWNFSNKLAGGCGEGQDKGLTKTGRRILKKMREKGILLDLAHIGKRSFYESLEAFGGPAIMSHTACREVYDSYRNIDDEQIKSIAQAGGAVGIMAYPQMIGGSSIEKFIEHMEHIADLVGTDHIVIGSDFGGMISKNLVEGLEETDSFPKLIEKMRKKGFSEDDIDKITRRNIEQILALTLYV